jgi:competence ComEA-like helix-hairpin-helix protein
MLFLISAFFIGLAAYLYKFEIKNPSEPLTFDYSEQDSLFNSAKTYYNENEKNVDSEQELLDFRENELKYKSANKKSLSDKSININDAPAEVLEQLPGIGKVTSQKIIDYRKKHGSFRNIIQIKEVKGIGDAKFRKIKKFIIVE